MQLISLLHLLGLKNIEVMSLYRLQSLEADFVCTLFFGQNCRICINYEERLTELLKQGIIKVLK